MSAFSCYCLEHVFNALSHIATNMIGGLIIKPGISPARTGNRFFGGNVVYIPNYATA